jgi:flagellar biosynthesis GTPase FlhF
MMKELNKKKVQEQLEQLKMDNQELEKQLDQNIELMKRLEMEKKVEEAIQKTEKLAEQQRELSQKTESSKTREEKDVMLAEHKKFREEWGKNILGEFCADAGKVGVFEWDKLGEKNQKWVTDHPWCAAVIKDFDGDVEFELIDESVHVVGTTENHTNDFFSTQSGY